MITLTDYDRKVYEKELKPFLPKEFIDCHVHLFKDDFPNPDGSFTKRPKISWVSRVHGELTADELVDIYKTLFPENKVTPLVFGISSKHVPSCNQYIKEVSDKFGFPSLFFSHYTMTPEYLEEEVKKGGFLGLKSYLSLRPSYIPVNEVRIFDFFPKEHLEVANKNGWIIMLHIPRDLRLRDAVNVAQIMEIEEKYPNLKLIVAHIGRAYAKEDIGDAFDVLKNTKNLVFDFTANLCDDAIRACIEAVGTKRLLFGSDLPVAYMRMYRIVENGEYFNVVPRGLYGDLTGVAHMRETDEKDVTLMIYEQLLALKRVATELKLTDSQIEDVMFLNSKRLIDGVK